MAEIDGIEIGISADTVDAQAGIKGVRDELNDLDGDSLQAAAALEEARESTDDLSRASISLTGTLSALANRASDAEDEIEEAGDSATQAAGGFAAMSGSVNSATVSLGLFNTTLTGTTIASLFALGSALAAVSTAALGVVGVLGAVGAAFGILGIAGVVSNLNELKRAFTETLPGIREAFEPLGDVFGPLLVEAVRSLDELAQNVVTAIQNAVGGFDAFRQLLARFGRVVFRVLPPLVGTLFEIAEGALPAINDTLDFLLQNGGDAFGVVERATRELLPPLQRLTLSLIDLLPDLVQFGTDVAQVILPPLTILVDIIDTLLEGFNALPDSIRQVSLALGGLALAASSLGVIGGGGGLLASLGLGGGAAAAGGGLLGGSALPAAGIAAGGLALTGFLESQSTPRSDLASLQGLGMTSTARPSTPQVQSVNIGNINANNPSQVRRAANQGVQQGFAGNNTIDTSRSG